MNRKASEFIGTILLILAALAITGLVYGLTSQHIHKLNNIASHCKINDFFIIEDACVYEISEKNYSILYLFIYRPIASEMNQTNFLIKLILEGKKLNLAFDNRSFFEYEENKIKNASSKIEKGEGKSFIIILNFYNITSLDVKEIAISMVGKKDNIEFSCSFGNEIKVKRCKEIKIENIDDIKIENIDILNNKTNGDKILNLPW